ncbi:hypothetical protein A3Q56_04365 [Intoshia linei]|uniref:SANT domain-containing protein n=1 Tax=Intoshia linei TaxID=1819745 RepID=A0A177B0P8_9BILA|nr:hypothetical protein A3Q56_04365 [Intoshia linei]
MENEMNVPDYYYANGSNPNGVSKSDLLMRSFNVFKTKRSDEIVQQGEEGENDESVHLSCISEARQDDLNETTTSPASETDENIQEPNVDDEQPNENGNEIKQQMINCRIDSNGKANIPITLNGYYLIPTKKVGVFVIPEKKEDVYEDTIYSYDANDMREYLETYRDLVYTAISFDRNMSADATMERYFVPLHSREAYNIIKKCKYDFFYALNKAKLCITSNMRIIIDDNEDLMWEKEEVFKFETALFKYGKNFLRIKKCISTRNVEEVSNFYSNWKSNDEDTYLSCFNKNKSISDILNSRLRNEANRYSHLM